MVNRSYARTAPRLVSRIRGETPTDREVGPGARRIIEAVVAASQAAAARGPTPRRPRSVYNRGPLVM